MTSGSSAPDLVDHMRSVEAGSLRYARTRLLGTWLALALLALLVALALALEIRNAARIDDQAQLAAARAQTTGAAGVSRSHDIVSYMRGQRGIVGVPGADGKDGTPGLPGSKGSLGPRGPRGSRGPQGPKGDHGQAGQPGTAGATGQTGAAGTTGEQGAKGDTGATGDKGNTGDTGAAGADGATGPPGPQGPAGADGATGPPGADGAPGPAGPQGAEGPAGITVVSGNVAADGTVSNGAGFTVARLGAGRYQITFAPPFAAAPTVVVTSVFGSLSVDAGAAVDPAENAVVDQALADSAIVATGDSTGALADRAFGFVAMTKP